jgi:hypothetical protein
MKKNRLKQKTLVKQNIENQKQELLIQMEQQRKENINLKSQYEMDIQNFKNELEENQMQLEQTESELDYERQTIFELMDTFNINNDKDSDEK